MLLTVLQFIFSRAVSTSGATYLVTMACVCLSGCLVVCISQRDPPPPPPPPQPVKGKNFDTRFGLIHVQTGEKFAKKFF